MTVVIMAAGMGSRYGGIKQIDPMGPSGEIILDYSVYDAIKAGFDRVVFIIRKDIEKAFRNTLGTRFAGRIQVDSIFQELDDLPGAFTTPAGRTKPWGTAHAVLACKETVKEPFAVINADDFYGADAFRRGAEGLMSMDSDRLEAFLVGYRLSNTLSPHGYVTRGVCDTDGRRVKGVNERFKIGLNQEGVTEYHDDEGAHPLTGDEVVSMNFWGFSPAIFPVLEERFTAFLQSAGTEMKSEFLLPREVDGLVSSGRMPVGILKTGSRWFGVTFPEDRPTVQASLTALVEKGDYPSPLW